MSTFTAGNVGGRDGRNPPRGARHPGSQLRLLVVVAIAKLPANLTRGEPVDEDIAVDGVVLQRFESASKQS